MTVILRTRHWCIHWPPAGHKECCSPTTCDVPCMSSISPRRSSNLPHPNITASTMSRKRCGKPIRVGTAHRPTRWTRRGPVAFGPAGRHQRARPDRCAPGMRHDSAAASDQTAWRATVSGMTFTDDRPSLSFRLGVIAEQVARLTVWGPDYVRVVNRTTFLRMSSAIVPLSPSLVRGCSHPGLCLEIHATHWVLLTSPA